MDLPYFRADEEDWDEYDHEEESEQYSSEDDIRQIEEALLQSIHYAEDYQEDADFPPVAGPAAITEKGEGIRDGLPKTCAGQTFPNITASSLGSADTLGGRTDAADGRQELGEVSESQRGECQVLASDKSERTLEPGVSSAHTAQSAPKKLKEKLQANVAGRSSPIPKEGTPDFREESRYKSIKPRKASDQISGINDCKSRCQAISVSSDEDDSSVKNRLIQSNIDIISVTEAEVSSDKPPRPKLVCPVAGDTAKPLPSSTKRQWRKSKEVPKPDDSGPATATTKKVKLKRTQIDAELRAALEAAKESSSDDDFEDAMLIESHSEDEALDVHCESDQTLKYPLHVHQPSSTQHRYYQEPRFRCQNCLQFGHMTRDCPKPKKPVTCVLCGTQGHTDRKCPDALCYICSEPGHQAKECANKKMQYMTCHRCSVRGHTAKTCPDRWRQYHLTTEPGNIISYEDKAGSSSMLTSVNGKVYCYNCSKQGHFGHECTEETMDWYAPLILPYVTEYDYIPKRFWTVQMDTPEPLGTGFPDARGPDQKALTSPSEQTPALPKKLKKKTKRILRQEAALALASAAGVQKSAPSTVHIQGRKPKRKREALDEDQVMKKQTSKKLRRENKEFESTQALDTDPSKITKKERQRLKKQVRDQRRNGVLGSQKETKMPVRNGRHISGMREESRSGVAMEDGQIGRPYSETAKTKKTKNSRCGKTKRGEAHNQQQNTQDHQVIFQPNFKQFPELERKFQAHNGDIDLDFASDAWPHRQQPHSQDTNDIWQDTGAGIGSSEALHANGSILSSNKKGKRKGKKAKINFQNEEQNNSHHKVPIGKGRGMSVQLKPSSKKQRKKQEARTNAKRKVKEASQDWRNFGNQQRAPVHQLKSSRGFRTLPKY